MKDAPSIPIVNACSTALSNTASPVWLLKSATSTEIGSRTTGGANSHWAPKNVPATSSNTAAADSATPLRVRRRIIGNGSPSSSSRSNAALRSTVF